MATQLNIKDAETIRRVRALASARGEPVTATIRALVDREWHAREEERERRVAETLEAVRDIQEEIRRKLTPEMRAGTLKEIMDSIYDEDEPDGFAK